MSNMVYACSILHKYRLPLTAAFNKCDVADHKPMFNWMEDFEAFHEALDRSSQDSPDGAGYVTSLHRSMSLVLDEFYRVLDRVAVSAVDGSGIDELFRAHGVVSSEVRRHLWKGAGAEDCEEQSKKGEDRRRRPRSVAARHGVRRFRDSSWRRIPSREGGAAFTVRPDVPHVAAIPNAPEAPSPRLDTETHIRSQVGDARRRGRHVAVPERRARRDAAAGGAERDTARGTPTRRATSSS